MRFWSARAKDDDEKANPNEIGQEGWLPDMDLNHDKQIQSLLCYRYTIRQWEGQFTGFGGAVK